jgi:hypothetical protein
VPEVKLLDVETRSRAPAQRRIHGKELHQVELRLREADLHQRKSLSTAPGWFVKTNGVSLTFTSRIISCETATSPPMR